MHQTKPEWERRDTNRLEIIRPCKVYVPRMEKYLAGTTWNISEGGALLQLNRPVVLERGQRVFVGIAAKRRDGLLRASDMLEAEVLRSLRTPSDDTVVAVRFAEPIALPMPLHALREAA